MKGLLWATARAGAVGIALVASACAERDWRTDTAAGQAPRTLSGAEIGRVLIGNTLVGYDSAGPFWMYYPSADTLWGQASNGDVDVGSWRIQGDQYCRAWRRWLDGRERCWRFTTDWSNRLIWLTPAGIPDGESTIQAGNSIGQIGEARALEGLVTADIEPAAGPPPGDEVVDAFGNRLSGRIGEGTEPARVGIDGGTGDGGANLP